MPGFFRSHAIVFDEWNKGFLKIYFRFPLPSIFVFFINQFFTMFTNTFFKLKS